MTGTVKRLVRDKGFGFLLSEDDGYEYFFHRTAITNARFEELSEGQRVTFDVGRGPKGPRAESVTT